MAVEVPSKIDVKPQTLADSSLGSTEAKRVKTFAAFFKSYMSVWTIVVAALPIPVAAFKLIPTFEAQRSYLSVYTSLFCFLALGFIFFQRHRLGYYMFRQTGKWIGFTFRNVTFADTMVTMTRGFVNWLPLAFILLSVFAVFRYHSRLSTAVLIVQAQSAAEESKGYLPAAFLADMMSREVPKALDTVGIAQLLLIENRMTDVALGSKTGEELSAATVTEAKRKANRCSASTPNAYQEAKTFLANNNPTILDAKNFIGNKVAILSSENALKTKDVPLSNELMFWYLVIFVAAETAFILMALKEYLQDLLHISDQTLMAEPQKQPAKGTN